MIQIQEFISCLSDGRAAGATTPPLVGEDSESVSIHDLVACIDLDHIPVGADSWLTGSLIDYVLTKFARAYPDVYFLSTTFAHFDMPNMARLIKSGDEESAIAEYEVKDVLGRVVRFTDDNPLVFFWNVGNMHWNLFRVVKKGPKLPELQLFEPMG